MKSVLPWSKTASVSFYHGSTEARKLVLWETDEATGEPTAQATAEPTATASATASRLLKSFRTRHRGANQVIETVEKRLPETWKKVLRRSDP